MSAQELTRRLGSRAPEDLARELAGRDDWRAAVAALWLPEREARALRVAILRRRAVGPRHNHTRPA